MSRKLSFECWLADLNVINNHKGLNPIIFGRGSQIEVKTVIDEENSTNYFYTEYYEGYKKYASITLKYKGDYYEVLYTLTDKDKEFIRYFKNNEKAYKKDFLIASNSLKDEMILNREYQKNFSIECF